MDDPNCSSSKSDDKISRGRRRHRSNSKVGVNAEHSTSQSQMDSKNSAAECSKENIDVLPKRKRKSARNAASVNSSQRGNEQLDEDNVLITGEKEIINLETEKPRVVDLTKESSSSSFVDLTSVPDSPRDSSPVKILCVNKIYQGSWNSFDRPSCMFEDFKESPLGSLVDDNETRLDEKLNEGASSSSSADSIETSAKKRLSCPICMDDEQMLKKRKRQLTSTMCGHVFCDRCIKNAVKLQNRCPTCRKKLTVKQLHPIYL